MRLLTIITGVFGTLALLFLMARTSGFVLIPLGLLTVIVVGYILYSIVAGRDSPYSRIATGLMSRSETEQINLSATDSCASCDDDDGPGQRETVSTEAVVLGVPLVLVGSETAIFCDLCADPLGATEKMDSIDRELERGRRAQTERDFER